MSKFPMKLIVNGTPYEVEVGDLDGDAVRVVVNGVAYEVNVEAEAASAPVPAVKPVAAAAPVAAPAPAPMRTPAPAPVQTAGGAFTVRAPMPGTILDIMVKTGDHVKAGQQLCALEAMKMKSAIRSPRDGIIANVPACEGAKVQYNDALFIFE